MEDNIKQTGAWDRVLQVMDHSATQWLFRLGLGILFIYAAAPKIMDPIAFTKDIAGYQLLPMMVIPTMAIVLPFVEVVAGLCLILGIWKRSAAIIITGLLAVFTVAISITVIRGIDISCGCFGTDNSSPVRWYTILRDASLMIPGAILILRDKEAVQFKEKSEG